MANIRPNIRQHPLLSRYPWSELSLRYSPGMLASACAHGVVPSAIVCALKRIINAGAHYGVLRHFIED